MYRPLLSYDELSGILEGKPSEFYDQLYKLLGLEQLTKAIDDLDAEAKRLREPGSRPEEGRRRAQTVLAAHEDSRAAAALAQVKKSKPDLDAVRPLITGAAPNVPAAWEHARQLTVPSAEEAEPKCAALRSAAQAEQQEVRRVDALAADRAGCWSPAWSFTTSTAISAAQSAVRAPSTKVGPLPRARPSSAIRAPP